MWACIQRRCSPLLAWLTRSARQHSSTRQIALAVASGAILGLVPKLGVVALLLLALLLRLQINRAAALGSVLVFSVLRLACEPFLHRAGFLVLTWKPIVPVWTWVYNLPLMPWTGFNNTQVMGGLVAGLYLSCPIYLLTSWVLIRYEAPITDWILRRVQSAQWLPALMTMPGRSA